MENSNPIELMWTGVAINTVVVEEFDNNTVLTNEVVHLHTEVVKMESNKLQLQQWRTPGLCMLWQQFETLEENIDCPELTIEGQHFAIVCYGGKTDFVAEERPMDYISPGIVEFKNCDSQRIPLGQGQLSSSTSLILIMTTRYVDSLLSSEPWLGTSYLHDIIQKTEKVNCSLYLDLPVFRILKSLVSEDISVSMKKYYFRMKIKELFFMLHLQKKSIIREELIPKDIQEKLATAQAYLLVNFHQAPTIKQLARIILLNEFKLKYYYKLRYGTTIKAYINHLRMEEANQLLRNGLNVNDVASQLGYKNVSHFILVFKRVFGKTPRQLIPRYKSNTSLPTYS